MRRTRRKEQNTQCYQPFINNNIKYFRCKKKKTEIRNEIITQEQATHLL